MIESKNEGSRNDALLAVVTGATGMIGGPIVRRLLDVGYRVRVLSRRQSHPDPRAELIKGDILDGAALTALFEKLDCFSAGLRNRKLIDDKAPRNHQNEYKKIKQAVSCRSGWDSCEFSGSQALILDDLANLQYGAILVTTVDESGPSAVPEEIPGRQVFLLNRGEFRHEQTK